MPGRERGESDQRRLRHLLQAGHAHVAITTLEEAYALDVVRDAALALSRDVRLWSIEAGVRDGQLAGSPPEAGTEPPERALQHFAMLAGAPLCVTLDLGPHLQNAKPLRALRNLVAHLVSQGGHLITVDSEDRLPEVVQAYATRLELSYPDARELDQIVRSALRRLNSERPIEIDIGKSKYDAILRNLRGLSRRQAERIIVDLVAIDRRLDDDDLNRGLAAKRQMLQADGLLTFVDTPVDLAEIGGLRRLKDWLKQRERSLASEAEAYGIEPPRGVLMLGVQGAGKSLCAKAIATAWQRPLLRLDVGVLYDRYVGETERRLRDALRQAELMSPIVLWIDEIEKAFASAAAQSADGGLSKRMFGSLLTWMQEHREPVFLVATANDIEALPPELLRKGRFDEIFFVDLPAPETRREIFEIHLRRRRRAPEQFDLDALAQASQGFSGAEIEQAVVAGLHASFAAQKELTTRELLAALAASPPLSVTMAERVAQLRNWAVGRCAAAD